MKLAKILWNSVFISALLVLFANAFAYDTSTPPPGYSPIIEQENREALFRAVPQQSKDATADILLIQTARPWNSDADTTVLNTLGYSYNSIDMSEVPTTDIDEYQVVLIVNDQVQSFYDDYAANYDKFDDYVKDGGVLVFFACDHGWARGNNYTDMPGHVRIGDRYNSKNIIDNYSHPIVTQELVGHRPLFDYPDTPFTDEDLYGNYCSHNYIIEGSLPEEAEIILRTDDSSRHPTLVSYRLGNGYVIGSGITWEAAFAWWDKRTIPAKWSYGRLLPDVFKYAFSLAGGHKTSGIKVDIYPEDCWLEKHMGIFKAKGDLIDIVACITNNTDNEQSNINLTVKIDSDLIDDPNDFLYVYKRASADEIALKPPVEIAPDDIFIGELNEQKIIIIKNITIKKKDEQRWNDFVFRFKLKDSLKKGTRIDAEAVVSGPDIKADSEKLSDGGSIRTIDKGNIIITNRELMYKTYARKKDNQGKWILDDKGVSELHELWKYLFIEAYINDAVIYYVDKYDKDGDKNHNNDVKSVQWFDDRETLPYDGTWNTNDDEDAINEVASLIDSMLDGRGDFKGNGFIKRLGKDKLHLLILGGDRIIPCYRAYDPTDTVHAYKEYHIASSITKAAADENYTFSDIIYRDTNGRGWKNGGVENIYVGRVSGTSVKNIQNLLISSSIKGSDDSSENVVKVENNRRDGELNTFATQSTNAGYTVVTEIEDKDNNFTNLDIDNPDNKTGIDDPACWNDDFKNLFTGNANNISDFDVIRFMCHGTVTNITDSEHEAKKCEEYFNGSNLRDADADIRSTFESFYPFFIFDACLVGLVDDEEKSTAGGDNYHLLNHLMPLNVRGIFAASGVTSSGYPTISSYNDYFTKYAFKENHSAGRAATTANKKGGDTLSNDAQSSYHSFIMNLHGCPWASLKTPKNRSKRTLVSQNRSIFDMIPKTYASDIEQLAKGKNTKTINIDCSNFNIASDIFNVLSIDGFDLLRKDESTPVIPLKTYEINIPLNATVENVRVAFENENTWNDLDIPAYKPPPPMPVSNATSGYIPCTSGLGAYPAEQYTHRIVEMADYKVVMITVFPVTFNTDTRITTLYRNIKINVDYTSPNSGILNKFSIEKKIFSVNESIRTTTIVENVSPSATDFSVIVEIENADGVIVETQSENALIPSNAAQSITVDMSAPHTDGSYTLHSSVSDGANIIGESSLFVKVKAGKILSFEGPSEIETGSYGEFTIEFQNFSDKPIEALENIIIYNHNNEIVARLPRLMRKIGAGESDHSETQWFPPESLPADTYKAQLVVTVGEAMFMTFDEFTIKTKSIPGDLNGDGNIDRNDINIIKAYLNQPAGACPDCDVDKDGTITGLDARRLVTMCTCTRCLCP